MSDDVYRAVFTVSSVLEVPVVLLALLALATVTAESGAFVMELWRRRRRSFAALQRAGASAKELLASGDADAASASLDSVAWSAAMGRTMSSFVSQLEQPGTDTRIAKELADFDFDRQRRLSRTRLLVRTGPALGLMGTLIPLSPALDGLARGNVQALTQNLRVAFSVTVLGLFVGAVAFALSLVRDRMYGQDFSDLEYVAAVLTDDRDRHTSAAAP